MTDRELVLELCKRLNLTKSSSYYVIGKEYQESEHFIKIGNGVSIYFQLYSI